MLLKEFCNLKPICFVCGSKMALATNSDARVGYYASNEQNIFIYSMEIKSDYAYATIDVENNRLVNITKKNNNWDVVEYYSSSRFNMYGSTSMYNYIPGTYSNIKTQISNSCYVSLSHKCNCNKSTINGYFTVDVSYDSYVPNLNTSEVIVLSDGSSISNHDSNNNLSYITYDQNSKTKQVPYIDFGATTYEKLQTKVATILMLT